MSLLCVIPVILSYSIFLVLLNRHNNKSNAIYIVIKIHITHPAVMVAGHGQHGDAPGGQLGQEPVQQGAGGGGGHGGVVNIARQHHGVHLIAVTQR